MANEFIARKGLIALDNSGISGSLDVSGSLTIESSGSTIFEVIGSEGQLFSITDNLSGSLFAVSDVSGLPILEVFSDDTVKIGTFNNEAITVSGSHTTIGGTLAIPGFSDISASLAANSIPAGTISGSAQVDHDATTNFSADEHFTQANITTVGTVTSGDVSAILPSGTVSSSAQITITESQISDLDHYTDSDVKTKLNTETVVSGSASNVKSFLNISSADISDVDAFSQSGTYASLRAQGTTASDVGLGNVTNESKATMFTSPTFTGTTAAPTPSTADDSTKIATTAYVQANLDNLIGNAGAALDTLGELSASLADATGSIESLVTEIDGKLAKSSNLSDLTNAATARTNLGVDPAGTDNSTNVTLAGSYDYITLSGQTITRNQIDASTDISNLTTTNVSEGTNEYYTDAKVKTKLNTENVVSGSATQVRSFLNVEDGADVTDTANVTTAGALMDSEVTSLSGIKTLTIPDSTTISTFGASLVDDTTAAAARTTLGLGTAATSPASDFVAVTGDTMTGALNINNFGYLTNWTTADTDIDGLLNGSTFGGLLQGPNSGHFVLGLKDNDADDSFAILSGDGNYTTDDTYDKVVFRARANGNVEVGGTLTIPGFSDVSASLAAAVAGGDDLGNHTATQNLDMGTYAITNVGNVDGVDVSALNSTVSTNTSNIATLTAATSSYLTTVDISDDTNLTAGTGITLTGDTLSTNDSQIVHDNLSGFVSNEHINHSSVTLTAGNGLTGGGDITTNRTFNVGAGDGISVAADSVAVDATVLRTTGDGVISSSAQIDHDTTTNFSADEHFTQANITTVGTVTSGDVSAILPSGVVSGSAQTVANLVGQDITVNKLTTTELVTNIVSSSITLTTGSNIFGDELTDTHQFTGSMDVTGSINGMIIKTVGDDGGVIKLSSDTANTSVSIGHYDTTATRNISIGEIENQRSNAVQIGGRRVGGGDSSVSIGDSAQHNHSTAYSIGIGSNANRFSNGDVGVGKNVLYNDGNTFNSAGTIAIGHEAGYNQDGTNNVILGSSAGRSSIGENSVYLGHSAGYYASGSGVVLLGYQAGYNLTGSNQLIIANTGSKHLIRGDFEAETVEITGSLDITSTLSIPGFSDVSASLAAAVAGGDDLGNHTATQNLNMGGYAITSVGNVDGVDVSTLKSDFDTLEGKTLVSGSSQIDLGSATGTAANATNASTASYVAGSNVDGTVALSSLATTAINATNASNIDVNNVSGNTEYGLVFRDGNGDGNQALYADNETDQPSYNPSTNTIKTPIISASSALYVGGNITVTGTVDGVDISTLNSTVSTNTTNIATLTAATSSYSTATGVENNADVTDTANVTAAGALMDSEVTSLSLIKGLTATQISGAFDAASASLAADIPTNNNQLTNGAGYTTNTGTVTSVGGTGTVDGLTLSGTVTTSGNLTLGGSISITTSSITNFPTEVSRSAAAAGFGSGGGGGISFNGSTANGLVTYGNTTTADVEANLTFDGTSLSIAGTLPLYTPSMTTGVDNSVVILDSDGYLKTDEIDSRVWQPSSLVDYTGTPQSSQLSYFNDSNTLAAAPTFTITGSGKFLQINDGDAASGPVGIYTDVVNDIQGVGGDIFVGDIAQIGSAISTVEGYVYNLSGSWAAALADDPSTSTGFLAIGTETTTSNTFLTRGYFNVTSSYFQGDYTQGAPIYIHVAATGRYNFAPPSASGDVSRIIGHAIDSFTPDRTSYVYYKIYFNPSPDWIEL